MSQTCVVNAILALYDYNADIQALQADELGKPYKYSLGFLKAFDKDELRSDTTMPVRVRFNGFNGYITEEEMNQKNISIDVMCRIQRLFDEADAQEINAQIGNIYLKFLGLLTSLKFHNKAFACMLRLQASFECASPLKKHLLSEMFDAIEKFEEDENYHFAALEAEFIKIRSKDSVCEGCIKFAEGLRIKSSTPCTHRSELIMKSTWPFAGHNCRADTSRVQGEYQLHKNVFCDKKVAEQFGLIRSEGSYKIPKTPVVEMFEQDDDEDPPTPSPPLSQYRPSIIQSKKPKKSTPKKKVSTIPESDFIKDKPKEVVVVVDENKTKVYGKRTSPASGLLERKAKALKRYDPDVDP